MGVSQCPLSYITSPWRPSCGWVPRPCLCSRSWCLSSGNLPHEGLSSLRSCAGVWCLNEPGEGSRAGVWCFNEPGEGSRAGVWCLNEPGEGSCAGVWCLNEPGEGSCAGVWCFNEPGGVRVLGCGVLMNQGGFVCWGVVS